MAFALSSLPPDCKILVIRLRSIGDVVLNTPVLENLKRNLPQCRLSVLVESPCDAVLKGNPFVDERIVRERKGSSSKNILKTIREEVSFFRELRRRRFDLVLDFHGGPRAANTAFLSGAPWKMGHKNSPRTWAYNLRVTTPYDGQRVHTVKEQLSKLAALGMKVEETAPRIWISKEEREEIRHWLAKEGIAREEPFAVVHPGIVKIHQRWRPEKMARVADYIQERLALRVVFASTGMQIPQVEEITTLMKPKITSLAGKTDLRQLIALLGEARFLVCHNGGQMHLAAAVGTPVLALFGSSTPDLFAPVGENHRIFYKRLPCSPCAPRPQYEKCFQGFPECMEKITAEEVMEAAGDLVKGGRIEGRQGR